MLIELKLLGELLLERQWAGVGTQTFWSPLVGRPAVLHLSIHPTARAPALAGAGGVVPYGHPHSLGAISGA